jgi:hypothetical protein
MWSVFWANSNLSPAEWKPKVLGYVAAVERGEVKLDFFRQFVWNGFSPVGKILVQQFQFIPIIKFILYSENNILLQQHYITVIVDVERFNSHLFYI